VQRGVASVAGLCLRPAYFWEKAIVWLMGIQARLRKAQ
jgi:hypothetical protein